MRKRIIRILQAYKGAWARLFKPQGQTIHLCWNREKKEIEIEAHPGGPVIDKDGFLHKAYRQLWDVKHLAPSLLTIYTVEKWLSILTTEEAEAIFWRYINHDWEKSSVEEEANGMPHYRTLSYREIAIKMGVSHAQVRNLCDRALWKITKIAIPESLRISS